MRSERILGGLVMSFSEWKEIKLGELLNFRRGHDLPKTKMLDGNIPVVGSNGIIGFHNEVTTKAPCLTIGRSGNIGNPCYINKDCWAHNTSLYVDDFKGNDPKYLYYLLKTLNLGHYGGGSAVPTLNRNHIHPIEIKATINLAEQKAIAHILSTLDDKIEVNNQINKTLDNMAQAIFKQWFMDFEFPNEDGEPYKSSGGEMVESELGMIPKGWEVKGLDEIAEFLNGLAMQKYRPTENEKSYPVLKIKELRQGRTDENSDLCSSNIEKKYIVRDGDIIFSWSGSLLVDIWCGGKCGLNQHLFKVTSDKHDQWFVYQWNKYHLDRFVNIAKSKATTMGHIKRKDLSDSKVLIPSDELYLKAAQYQKYLFEKIMYSKIEIKRLEEIRDSLLPKLMSGEIRVPLNEEGDAS